MQLPNNHSASVTSSGYGLGRHSERTVIGGKKSSRVGLATGPVSGTTTWGPSVGRRPGIVALQEKRRRRRVAVPPMYTSLILRNLAQRTGPVEGYVVDLSETGMAIEADSLVPVGQVVTVEFQIAGVGPLRNENWPEFAAAAEVVRHDNLEDFPGGPYRMALRFVKMSTIAQAQIARYVATQPA